MNDADGQESLGQSKASPESLMFSKYFLRVSSG